MLGRLKRTTGTDVGLALSFTGVTYLVWALVAAVSRSTVQEMIKSVYEHAVKLPPFTSVVKVFFVDMGFVIDLVGLAWMTLTLVLIFLSARQRFSISWAWVSAMCQAFVAAIGAVLVGWAAFAPYSIPITAPLSGATPWQQVSSLSTPVIVPIAVLVWVTVLVWLLVERARINRHGPTLRDGLKTNR